MNKWGGPSMLGVLPFLLLFQTLYSQQATQNMNSELGAIESPRKWRYTWEAQSHIPTLRLLLFNPTINPKSQCTNLKFDLNLEQSLLHVSCFDDTREEEVSLSVPIPRVLVDVDSPLSFKSMDDNIEVKLLLLVPVDHPINSNFGLNSSKDGSELSNVLGSLVMDSDQELLSSKGGIHFYCRNCSTKLTGNPIRHFDEMPSADWREVADNWFGACCCSFGGISEKLVTKYANSYSFSEGTCLLSMTFIVLCKDDLLGCKFPDWDGYQKYGDGSDFDGNVETAPGSGSNHVRKICCEDHSAKMHDIDGKLSFTDLDENLRANLKCEFKGTENNGELGSVPALDIPQKLASGPGCCNDWASYTLNLDPDNCSHDVSETSLQEPIKSKKLLEHQKSFLNGFLGNPFMVRSSHLSKDVDWINFECRQCSSVLGAYPCKNGYGPVDGGVRLFKCYISTSLPICKSDDVFRKYTLERMFTNQLLENANDEISFRTVVRDIKMKSPALQIVLLNPNSWCCSGYSLGTDESKESVSKIDLRPILKLLFSDCSYSTESQLRNIEEWIIKNQAEEVYMLKQQIQDLIESLESAKDAFPPSYAFMQGLPLSFLQR